MDNHDPSLITTSTSASTTSIVSSSVSSFTPRIHAIDQHSIHRICSGQVITSLSIAIKELVENAIDAHATTIDIRLREYGTENFEVYDNGSGISSDNYEGLTAKYHTSKISSFEDIFSVPTFGFRGEAISSLCEVAGNFTVITRTPQDTVGTKLEYDHSGKLVRTVPIARTVGTTIMVQHLFQPLPVRYREFLKSARKQYGKMLLYLQAYALILTKVRILVSHVVTGSLNTSLAQITTNTGASYGTKAGKQKSTLPTHQSSTNEGSNDNEDENGTNVPHLSVGRHTVLATSGSGTLKDNIIEVFGAKFFSTLEPFTIEYRTVTGGSSSSTVTGTGNITEDISHHETNHPSSESDEGSSEREDESFSSATPVFETIASSSTPLQLSPKILRQKLTQITINGYVSKAGTGIGRSNNDRQFLYINNRPVELPKVTKIINDVWRTYEMNHKPAYVLNFLLPSGIYDINVTPDKREVFLAGENIIMDHLKSRLHLLWEASRRTFTIAPTLATSTVAHLQMFDHPTKEYGTNDGPKADGERERADDDEGTKQKNGEDLKPKRSTGAIIPPTDASGTGTNDSPRLPYRMKSPPTIAEYMESYHSNVNPTITIFNFNNENGKDNDTMDTTTTERGIPVSPRKTKTNLSSPSKAIPKRAMVEDSPLRTEMKRFRHGEDDEAEAVVAGTEEKNLNTVMNNTVPNHLFETEAANRTAEANRSFPSSKEYVDPVEAQLRKIYADDISDDGVTEGEKDTMQTYERTHSNQNESIDLEQIRSVYAQRKGNHLNIKQRIMEATDRSGAVIDEPVFIPFFDRYVNHDELFEQETLQEMKIGINHAGNALRENEDGMLDVGTIGVIASDPQAAEETFTRVLNKTQFRTMANRIIGQFNLGFIIARTENDIYILDQHACDEKYQYETLKATTRIHEQRLIAPRKIDLTAAEELIILDHMEIFNANGFHFVVDENAPTGSRIKVSAVPFTKNIQFGDEDIQELTSLLSEGVRTTMTTTIVDPVTNNVKTVTNMVRLPKANAMFASRACRSAIMIGTALKHETMHRVVSQLAQLEHPWSCPHGRPTLRHLLDVSSPLIANAGKLAEAGTDNSLIL